MDAQAPRYLTLAHALLSNCAASIRRLSSPSKSRRTPAALPLAASYYMYLYYARVNSYNVSYTYLAAFQQRLSLRQHGPPALLTVKSAGRNVGLEPDKTLGARARNLFGDSNRR
jgi:hypothetical protein